MASPRDPWLGRDKAKHFGLSVALQVGTWAASGALTGSPRARLLAGVAVGLGVGVGKELRDLHTGRGTPSWRDLTWDVAGVGTGLALSRALDRLLLAPGRRAL